VIEQIGNDLKQDWYVSLHCLMRDRNSQMCFSAPIWPGQNQPTLRVIGKLTSGLKGIANSSHLGMEVVKSQVLKGIQVRKPQKRRKLTIL
jgi:hypothetical protein